MPQTHPTKGINYSELYSYLLLEPLHGLFLGNPVRKSHVSLGSFSLCHVESRTTKDHIEIHAINTNGWVILYS